MIIEKLFLRIISHIFNCSSDTCGKTYWTIYEAYYNFWGNLNLNITLNILYPIFHVPNFPSTEFSLYRIFLYRIYLYRIFLYRIYLEPSKSLLSKTVKFILNFVMANVMNVRNLLNLSFFRSEKQLILKSVTWRRLFRNVFSFYLFLKLIL